MRSRPLLLLGAAALVLASCGDDDASDQSGSGEDVASSTDADSTTDTAADEGSTSSTDATASTDAAADGGGASSTDVGAGEDGGAVALAVVEGEPFSDERCALNEEAGTITFLTGFDFAAAASIVDVIVAEQAGFYDELCLDVVVRPSFSTANYPLVAENEAQFASGGSFSEVVQFAAANDAEFRAVSVEGRTPIDVLITKPDAVGDLGELAGTTIGVKGKLPSSVAAMLLEAGLVEGTDFDTVLLDGFDPTAHIAIDAIVGFPGWKSNETGQLERGGIPFDTFDPADLDIPGSFGAIYTNEAFIADHPTAAEDFVRATMRGLAEAVADPAAAATTAVDLINENGNPNFLSPEGEVFRWETEAALITDAAGGEPLALPSISLLQEELDAYAEIGLFGNDAAAPDAADFVDTILIGSIYSEPGEVIWPG